MCKIARELNLPSAMLLRKGVFNLFTAQQCNNVMHQSIETLTPWVLGKGRGFDINPGQKALISLPPEARVQINCPNPLGNKEENIKSFKKKDVFKRRNFPSLHVQVCSFDLIISTIINF